MAIPRRRAQRRSFDEVAIEKGFLGFRDIERAVAISQKTGCSMEDALIKERLITDQQVAEVFSEILEKPIFDFSEVHTSMLVPVEGEFGRIMRERGFLIFDEPGKVSQLVMANPTDPDAFGAINQYHPKPVEVYAGILGEIRAYLGSSSTEGGKTDSPKARENLEDGQSATDTVDEILKEAIGLHASDIHIEPEETFIRVRMRIDGVMSQQRTLPTELHVRLMARLKILSQMDIAEKRKAQDGSFRFRMDQKVVDFRVSTLPTVRGEKAVIRILDKSHLSVKLEDLGLKAPMVQQIQQVAQRPYGIILVTGPTGSGKTTTVYSILNYLNQLDRNIITVEDPVEFQFELMNQVQVNEKAGVTFSNVLRNILRQDPDIIMIGEIRDRETAELAVRAALTGHLVISTIHTNDAIGTVGRLVDMGIEPYLLASALSAVISQRLIRKLCPGCRSAASITEEDRARLQSPKIAAGQKVHAAKGCLQCLQTGYKGRRPLFEMMVPSAAIQQAIAAGAEVATIQKLALDDGFQSMRQNGIESLIEGVTSVDEVLRATM